LLMSTKFTPTPKNTTKRNMPQHAAMPQYQNVVVVYSYARLTQNRSSVPESSSKVSRAEREQ